MPAHTREVRQPGESDESFTRRNAEYRRQVEEDKRMLLLTRRWLRKNFGLGQ